MRTATDGPQDCGCLQRKPRQAWRLEFLALLGDLGQQLPLLPPPGLYQAPLFGLSALRGKRQLSLCVCLVPRAISMQPLPYRNDTLLPSSAAQMGLGESSEVAKVSRESVAEAGRRSRVWCSALWLKHQAQPPLLQGGTRPVNTKPKMSWLISKWPQKICSREPREAGWEVARKGCSESSDPGAPEIPACSLHPYHCSNNHVILAGWGPAAPRSYGSCKGKVGSACPIQESASGWLCLLFCSRNVALASPR